VLGGQDFLHIGALVLCNMSCPAFDLDWYGAFADEAVAFTACLPSMCTWMFNDLGKLVERMPVRRAGRLDHK